MRSWTPCAVSEESFRKICECTCTKHLVFLRIMRNAFLERKVKKKMYERPPQYVRQHGLFCLWRYEERNGKKTKVPYRLDGRRANSTKASDFALFSDVLRMLPSDRYDGIGMMVHEDLSAIDIDHCVEGGKLSPLAQEIVDMVDSYTEYSPSGTGIRILVRTGGFVSFHERFLINNRRLGLEIYIAGSTSKFVTLTGNAIRERDAEVRTEEILAIAHKYMLRKAANKPSVSAPDSFLSDDSVLTTAFSAMNGSKAKKLWDGDTSDYPSRSEAELALCSILAFYCGGDTEQMDRLIRRSSLYREKWERDDYRQDTLRKAVAGCSDFYRPMRISSATEDFGGTVETLRNLDILSNHR